MHCNSQPTWNAHGAYNITHWHTRVATSKSHKGNTYYAGINAFFPTGGCFDIECEYIAQAETRRETIRGRSHEEDVFIGLDANVEVASRHGIAGSTGVVGIQTHMGHIHGRHSQEGGSAGKGQVNP